MTKYLYLSQLSDDREDVQGIKNDVEEFKTNTHSRANNKLKECVRYMNELITSVDEHNINHLSQSFYDDINHMHEVCFGLRTFGICDLEKKKGEPRISGAFMEAFQANRTYSVLKITPKGTNNQEIFGY